MPQTNFDYKFNFRIEGNTEVVASFDAIIGLLDEVKTKTVEIRDTSTDAFGRLIKNSYREQDAIRGTVDLFRTQAQVMRNLNTQNTAIIEGARRRGFLLAEEEVLLRKNVAQMDQFGDSLLLSTTRMDRQSESFIQGNILYRDIQRYARGAENAIENFGDEAITASQAQEYFNDAMQAFKSDGQIIVNQMRVLAREMESGKIETQSALQVWDMYQNELDRVIAELRNFIETQDLSADEMARATSVLANLTDAAGNAQRGFAGTRGTMLGMNKVASSANQIMLSFGDIVQDSAQFSFGFAQGARAIGNNIAFAAEQFVILQANMKAAQGQTVTLGATMRALGSSLIGPIGVVVLINTLVTAITMTAQASQKATNELDDLVDTIYNLSKSVRDLPSDFDVLEKTGLSRAVSRFTKLKEELDENNKLINRAARLFSRVIPGYGATAEGVKKADEAVRNLNQTQAEANRIQAENAILQELTPDQIAQLNERIQKRGEELKLEKAFEELFLLNVTGAQQYRNAISELDEAMSELAVSEAKRLLGLDDTGVTEEMTAEKIKNLAKVVSEANMDIELQTYLLERLAKAYEQVAEKSEDSGNKLEEFANSFSLYAQQTATFISSLTQLNQTTDKSSEAAARRQFERQKRLSYASAVVAGADAFVKALAQPPSPNIPLAALAAATTAIQLATIRRQKFSYDGGDSGGGGGITSAISSYTRGLSATAPTESTGFGQGGSGGGVGNDVRYAPSRATEMSETPIIINNYADVDGKKLYITTEYGRKQFQRSSL